jgi:hypothetical protein
LGGRRSSLTDQKSMSRATSANGRPVSRRTRSSLICFCAVITAPMAAKFAGSTPGPAVSGRHSTSSALRTRLPGSPSRRLTSDAGPSLRPNRISSQLVRVWASEASDA